MLNPARALSLHASSGRKLPRVEAFADLYSRGFDPRHGQVIMVAGRSGSQKSGFALFWVSEMNLDTLYFSADMSPFTASVRIASCRSKSTSDEVEAAMKQGGLHRERVLQQLEDSRVTFSFGSPITWRAVDEELEAYVDLHNKFPDVVVFDNLMDFAGAESDYAEQMAVMQGVTELARETGSTVIIMHHASDKSWDAKRDPYNPPSRAEVKGGLSEKPEISLGVALDPNSMDFKVAVLKQRAGAQDPTGRRFATLVCQPEQTRFRARTGHGSRMEVGVA